MSGMNGEPHKRVRMAAQKGFGSPRALDMADYVKRLVGEIADRMAEAGGEADIIELAYRVPLLVVMRMLGAPVEDMDLLRPGSDATAGMNQIRGAAIPPEKGGVATDRTVQPKAN